MIDLKKSTFLIVGIICFNLIVLANDNNRHYELQFPSTNFLHNLNYNDLCSLGIDKIIVRVFHAHKKYGGLRFKNSYFKYNDPILDSLMKEISGSCCELWAWMITRRFAWLKTSDLFDFSRTERGKKQIPKLDIFNPEAIDKITAVFKELAKNKISGILIQDDLFIRYNEGFSNWGKARFNLSTGQHADENQMMAKDTPLNHQWVQVKVRQVTDILKRLIRECKSVHPGIQIGMNIFYEAPVFKKNAAAWYAHSLEEITATELDSIYLMSYHRQIKREMKFSEAANRKFFKKLIKRAYEISGEKLVAKVQLRDWRSGERIPVSEIRAYLTLVDSRVKRICFTPVTFEDQQYLHQILDDPPLRAGELLP